MSQMENSPEITMDANALSREEVFTDSRVGTIRKMTPVTIDGDVDSSRPLQFVGSTQIMTPGGALPLSFEVEANSLEEAIVQFGAEAKKALESTMQKLEEMRREAASSLIVPGSAPPGAGGGIQIP